MSLQVRGDRVIVRLETQPVQKINSLYLVDQYAPDVMGTIIACGETVDVKLDDLVIFPESAGQRMDYEGEPLLVLREDELIAVLE